LASSDASPQTAEEDEFLSTVAELRNIATNDLQRSCLDELVTFKRVHTDGRLGAVDWNALSIAFSTLADWFDSLPATDPASIGEEHHRYILNVTILCTKFHNKYGSASAPALKGSATQAKSDDASTSPI
jgi:hypothetical protein